MAERSKHNTRRAARRAEKIAFIHSKKNKACSDCGDHFHPVAMQFDHVRGEKEFGIAESTRLELDVVRIEREIEKCELVCANCHSMRTYARLKNLDVDSFFAQNNIEYRGHIKRSEQKRKQRYLTLETLLSFFGLT